MNRTQLVVGDFNNHSCFMATRYVYFPFLNCKVKCGATALDVADRQNAHSEVTAVDAVSGACNVIVNSYALDRQRR